MSSDPNCVFCRIAIAFLDINPVAPGHVLLVPKAHSANISQSTADSIARAAAELPRLVSAIMHATGASGLNIIQNNGRDAGQLIDHVHFHLIPRHTGDAFDIPWPKSRYEGDALGEMRTRLERAFQAASGSVPANSI
jgi:histidine triad (HIT) family protein